VPQERRDKKYAGIVPSGKLSLKYFSPYKRRTPGYLVRESYGTERGGGHGISRRG